MRNILLLGVSLIAFAPHHAQAQWLFKKAAPKVPAQRVPELIQTLRGDPDERKRSAAAEELREYDAKAFPQILPGLVEAALRDSKHGVRSDALHSLSRIRPVSPMAGQALEYAAANDTHWSNRIQAKSSLLRYQWAGYTPGSGDKNPPVAPDTKEPVTAARPQPNNLPPIVSVPTPTPNGAIAGGSNPPMPVPQFPNAGNAPYPYQAQNPLTSVSPPPMQAPNAVMKNPLAVSPVNRSPYQAPPVPSVPVPGTFEPIPMPPVAGAPKTGTFEPIAIPVPQPTPPVAAKPLPMPEPKLQFRPVNQPIAPITVTPGEIPLIDLNPVLTNPGTPAVPIPPAVVTPPLVVPNPDAGRTPLPPLPNEVPGLPLPKI